VPGTSPGLFCLRSIRAASLTPFGQDKGDAVTIPAIHRGTHCFISAIVAAAGGYIVMLDEPAKTRCSNMTISNLHSSEVDDFKTELKRQHRSLDEFDVSATPQRLDDESGAVSATRGTVTIKLRKTGAERTYATGHGSTWVVQFADDLRVGLFPKAA
jgi:hypothetical protein